jgi:pimeloyl-ACP methyl ester carboxylesterase
LRFNTSYMNSLLKRISCLLLVAVFFTACKDDDSEVQVTPVVLSSYELLATKSQAEIDLFARIAGLPAGTAKYDVEVYKVTYFTTFKNASIKASGLILLPKTSDAVSMLSFQHGTIIAHSDAPSQISASNFNLPLYAALATPGFIGVIPDYIGFGSSKDIAHPYYVEKATADAIIDNMKAARELALIKKLNFKGDLFLAGYSQGGYATMATHKAIEEHGLEDFNLIASFPASGGYDLIGVSEYLLGQETYDNPYYIAYITHAYKTALSLPNILTDFFKEPYASRIPSLFTGNKAGGEVDAELTNTIADLVNSDIRSSLRTNIKFKYIADAFKENSLTDWAPKTKMYMYHGDRDTVVPYENSVSTYNQLIINGASPQVVTFTALPLADHSTGVTPYLVDLLNKLISLKKT